MHDKHSEKGIAHLIPLALIAVVLVAGTTFFIKNEGVLPKTGTSNKDLTQVAATSTSPNANSMVYFKESYEGGPSLEVMLDQPYSYYVTSMLEPRQNDSKPPNKITSVEIHIRYDYTYLQFDSVVPSEQFPNIVDGPVVDNTKGTAFIKVAVRQDQLASGLTTRSEVATFNFKPIATKNGLVEFDKVKTKVDAVGESENVVLPDKFSDVRVISMATMLNSGTGKSCSELCRSKYDGCNSIGNDGIYAQNNVVIDISKDGTHCEASEDFDWTADYCDMIIPNRNFSCEGPDSPYKAAYTNCSCYKNPLPTTIPSPSPNPSWTITPTTTKSITPTPIPTKTPMPTPIPSKVPTGSPSPTPTKIIITPSRTPTPLPDIVRNGGFEGNRGVDGIPNGWVGTNLVRDEVVKNASRAHSGENYFRFTPLASKNSKNERLSQTRDYAGKKGDMLTFDVWSRSADKVKDGKVTLITKLIYKKEGSKITSADVASIVLPLNNQQWTKRTVYMPANNNYLGYEIIFVNNNTSTGYAIDDVSLHIAPHTGNAPDATKSELTSSEISSLLQ